MKNEVMARAFAGIDDKLIEDAETYKGFKRNFKPVYALCAVAACLVLVLTVIFSFPKNAPSSADLLLNGEVISDSPMEIHIPAAVSARETNKDINLSLSLKISEDTKIRVSHGKMDIGSSDGSETIFSGTEYETNKPVNISWHIGDTDINTEYKLTLGDHIVYTMTFDENTSLWSICKQ